MALLLGTGSGGLTRVRKRDYTDLDDSPPPRRHNELGDKSNATRSKLSSSSSSSSSELAGSAPWDITRKKKGRRRPSRADVAEEEDGESSSSALEQQEESDLDLRAVWRSARTSSAGAVVTTAAQNEADRADRRDPAVGSYRYVDEERDYKPLLPPKVANPANATDFLFVPYTLERLISYGIFICMDSFMFVFTALPIRAAIALYHLVLRQRKLHAIQKVDILKVIILILGYLFLRLLDIPSLSSFMAKESLLKIKYLVTLLVVMDRLMSSYGQNILGSLFWAVNQPASKVKRGYWWHFILSIVYVNIHSTFLLGYIAVMDVAMEGKNTALLTLLILIQFAEMKSAVLKELTQEKLWAICYNDIVERFQLLVSLVLLFFYNISKHHINSFWDEDWLTASEWLRPLLFSLLIIYLSELAVDWLKHTSIINFTDLSPHIYTEVAYKISKRLLDVDNKSFLTDRTQNIATGDLGVMPLSLGVLVLKVIGDWMPSGLNGLAVVVGLYALGLLMRQLSGLLLTIYTRRFHVYRQQSGTAGKLFLMPQPR